MSRREMTFWGVLLLMAMGAQLVSPGVDASKLELTSCLVK